MDNKLKSNYATPKKTKETEGSTWTSRRRPTLSATTTVARLYENLANNKITLSNLQLDVVKAEKENIISKAKWEEDAFKTKSERDEELFHLQKESLLLDIKIKKAQLEKLNSFK